MSDIKQVRLPEKTNQRVRFLKGRIIGVNTKQGIIEYCVEKVFVNFMRKNRDSDTAKAIQADLEELDIDSNY